MTDLKIHGFNKDDLIAMDVGPLRSILHERTHHTIEVSLYRILDGKLKKPNDYGAQAKFVLGVWKERDLPLDTPDLKWCIKYIEIAEALNSGRNVKIEESLPVPFTGGEMAAVEKLLYERRSIRQFTDRSVSKEIVRKILHAGLMAPQGCNVDARRFIVLRRPEDWKLVLSDIPLEHGVMILVCEDMRSYKVLGFDKRAPQNYYFDVACAADHICLMAHALGLGAVWLTHGEETQKRIRERFGLPETFYTRCHIMVGWPAEAPIKSLRMSLDDAIIWDS
jgi:nitroreductase